MLIPSTTMTKSLQVGARETLCTSFLLGHPEGQLIRDWIISLNYHISVSSLNNKASQERESEAWD